MFNWRKFVAKRNIKNAIQFFIGYMLSPLSFWNDWFVNIPIAYLISLPFSIFGKNMQIVVFALAYLFTNWLGFYLMGDSLRDYTRYKRKTVIEILLSAVYVIFVAILIYLGILPSWNELLKIGKKVTGK